MIEKILSKLLNFILCNIKFLLLKMLHIRYFKYNFINYCSFFTTIHIRNKGKLCILKGVKIENGVTISSLNNGNLLIKENVFINKNCYIVSHDNIIIGKNVIIGPNTVIVDHDHFISKNGIERKRFKTDRINIGDNTWIGANCTILKGAHIGSNCVIAAGSIVNGDIADNTIYINKHEKILKKVGD